ncbi:MAG TPA: CoA transferase [Acidimicrobiales bacterium]|nr:CoA transferase [Acidimicrobiales bacterium]
MTGVLEGIRVLDLSWGVAGPAAAMLLADHGAEVTRIERPEPDPFVGWLDYRVYNRGKRSAVLDLHDAQDRERLRALAAHADVLIESFAPGVTARLGIDYPTLAAANGGLVYCSITGYGPLARWHDRPAFDQLVAARTGYQWEVRAWPGSVADHLAGRDLFGPDTAIPEAERRWLDRDGPVFTATPAPSISAAYLATLGISAALRAREHTGRGQHVETSLLQGVIAYQGAMWQRSEREADFTGRPLSMGPIMNYGPGVTVMSGPWSLYECADGRWVNQWTSRPEWAILAGAGDQLCHPDPAELAALLAETGGRDGRLERQLQTRLQAKPIFAKFPQAEWVRLAAEAGVAVQPVRAPEEVLCDPELLAQGAVVEVDDPDLGRLRQPGILYRMQRTPGRVQSGARRRGADTSTVRAEADDRLRGVGASAEPARTTTSRDRMAGPLEGVRALDFGLAVAGPWGGELLAQLGAEVIKIDPPRQNMWLSTNMAMTVNRSKRHLSLDVKTPQGLEVAHELVRRADIVLMNIRPQAAMKLGLDYESLAKVNPALIYCRTAGFDESRAHLPGNDQTGNAVGGAEWEDGGVARGGRPYWSVASGGDLGNGYFSAIAMVQALYHRDRTGEGQALDTNILNASMFSSGRVYTTPDGTRIERPTVDPDLLGYSALYRLYACRQGWLCVAVFGDEHWDALTRAVPTLATDPRFATREGRYAHDAALAAVLEREFGAADAAEWFARLDAAGVPCEISSPEFALGALDDPDLRDSELFVTRGDHRMHGRMETFGRLIGFSDTQAPIGGPAAVPGQHSREILRDVAGYADADIDKLCAAGAVFEAPEADAGRGEGARYHAASPR